MFDTIILLTGPAEQSALSALLKSHNPQLTVHVVNNLPTLEALERRVLRRARLVAFLTPLIVPQRILEQLCFGAYNFHPGPPGYPGWVPSHFAIYDEAKTFGATAHIMTAQVDAGPIIGIELFDIPREIGVLGLERLAFTAAAKLFWALAKALATQEQSLGQLPIHWCGRKSTRRMYEAMCDIPLDITNEELNRRVKAFGVGHFGTYPTITVNGYRFRYVKSEDEKVASPTITPAV